MMKGNQAVYNRVSFMTKLDIIGDQNNPEKSTLLMNQPWIREREANAAEIKARRRQIMESKKWRRVNRKRKKIRFYENLRLNSKSGIAGRLGLCLKKQNGFRRPRREDRSFELHIDKKKPYSAESSSSDLSSGRETNPMITRKIGPFRLEERNWSPPDERRSLANNTLILGKKGSKFDGVSSQTWRVKKLKMRLESIKI